MESRDNFDGSVTHLIRRASIFVAMAKDRFVANFLFMVAVYPHRFRVGNRRLHYFLEAKNCLDQI